ncbi:MAG: TrkH family potassium uptake protein [Sphingobacteriia bacterium]|nr:TrkH family potassium uptake protein [Sphingobacteriia bacterium]
MNFIRAILKSFGFSLVLFGTIMLIPAIIDLASLNRNYKAFLYTSLIGVTIGTFIKIFNTEEDSKTVKSAFLITVFAWLSGILYCAIPFIIIEPEISVTDALFESTSGLTSCGATIFTNLQEKSKGFLFYRILLNYIGGVGIVMIGIAILPSLQIGGMQLFKMEYSDQSKKILPKVGHIAVNVLIIYFSITLLGVLFLYSLGMNFFDALCHGMSAISTGGFTNYDNSITHFNNIKVDLILILLMILGSQSFIHYYNITQGNFKEFINDPQTKTFFTIIILAVTSLTFWLHYHQHFDYKTSLRLASFNAVSIMTTTGFSQGNYDAWGDFPRVLLSVLSLIGGCTGSTSGGIKLFRLEVTYKVIKYNIRTLLHPHGVFKVYFGDKPLTNNAISGAISIVILYFFGLIIGSLLLTLNGLDFMTAISASISAISNSGFGIGEIINPDGSYALLPSFTKIVLTVLMIFGRLEFFTLLVLINPLFWRK